MTVIAPPGTPASQQTIKHGPRFASPVNSPAWEWKDDTQFLEVTRGCSHNGCRFCTFYKDVPYSKTPLSDIEYHLEYLSLQDKRTPVRRVFLQAANAFHLSYDELMTIGDLIHKHLPHVESIGGYGRMSDLRDKSVAQLEDLHRMGYGWFYFGVESADDVLLACMNKGYDSVELYEAGMKLHESGMPWTCAIILGLGGEGYGFDHAIKTADFFNATKPDVVGAVSLTLVYDPYTKMEPPLLQDVREGAFIEAGEIERYLEMREFIRRLNIETTFTCKHSTMPYGFNVRLPEQKADVLKRLDQIIEERDEHYMRLFRASVREV